jgi:hypothetical protein
MKYRHERIIQSTHCSRDKSKVNGKNAKSYSVPEDSVYLPSPASTPMCALSQSRRGFWASLVLVLPRDGLHYLPAWITPSHHCGTHYLLSVKAQPQHL